MIIKIGANRRHYADHGWLKTYYLFSFANYFDPHNMNFGTLRVFNDDRIAGEFGFGAHSHDNMEIVTIVHEGELTHQDSLGNTGKIRAGEVQYMSAGTGVTHAELNQAKEPVHLYQIWILPNEQNAAPHYDQKDFSKITNKNALVPVASGQNKEGALAMRTDATIYTCELEDGQEIKYNLGENRGAFIYVKEGAMDINGTKFNAADQARIQGESQLVITASETCKFILIDVPLQ